MNIFEQIPNPNSNFTPVNVSTEFPYHALFYETSVMGLLGKNSSMANLSEECWQIHCPYHSAGSPNILRIYLQGITPMGDGANIHDPDQFVHINFEYKSTQPLSFSCKAIVDPYIGQGGNNGIESITEMALASPFYPHGATHWFGGWLIPDSGDQWASFDINVTDILFTNPNAFFNNNCDPLKLNCLVLELTYVPLYGSADSNVYVKNITLNSSTTAPEIPSPAPLTVPDLDAPAIIIAADVTCTFDGSPVTFQVFSSEEWSFTEFFGTTPTNLSISPTAGGLGTTDVTLTFDSIPYQDNYEWGVTLTSAFSNETKNINVYQGSGY